MAELENTKNNNWIQTLSGDPLPCPAFGSSGITISTAIDGGKNALGNFIGTVVGDDKLKYDLSFPHLSPEEFQRFLNLFDVRRGGKFAQTFLVFDPRVNDFREMTMYVGDRTGRPMQLDNHAKPLGWLDIKTTLIEI